MRPFRRQPIPSRPLTAAEARVARGVFGDALDVEAVRVHGRPWFPLQGRGVAMAPDGQLWFRPEDYRADFTETLGSCAWLVHELVHAWQHQQGRPVLWRGLCEQLGRPWRNPYRYGAPDPARPFHRLLHEQQAAMVEDWFLLTHGARPRHGSGTPNQYRAAIPFLPREEFA